MTLSNLLGAAAALALQSNPLPESPEMTVTGWLFLGLAWSFVIGLLVVCFAKVIWGGKPS